MATQIFFILPSKKLLIINRSFLYLYIFSCLLWAHQKADFKKMYISSVKIHSAVQWNSVLQWERSPRSTWCPLATYSYQMLEMWLLTAEEQNI